MKTVHTFFPNKNSYKLYFMFKHFMRFLLSYQNRFYILSYVITNKKKNNKNNK